jgi:hypothetical protein
MEVTAMSEQQPEPPIYTMDHGLSRKRSRSSVDGLQHHVRNLLKPDLLAIARDAGCDPIIGDDDTPAKSCFLTAKLAAFNNVLGAIDKSRCSRKFERAPSPKRMRCLAESDVEVEHFESLWPSRRKKPLRY